MTTNPIVQNCNPERKFERGERYLSNPVREHLLMTGRGELAIVLDIVYWLGLGDGACFTVEQLQALTEEAGVMISPYLLRRALNDPLFQGCDIPRETRGRPQKRYRVPVYAIVSKLAPKDGTSDPLSAVDLSSLRNYRAGLHRELISRRPGRYSRQFLSRRLGVAPSTTRDYEKDIIKVTPHYDVQRVVVCGTLPSRGEVGREFLVITRNFEEDQALHVFGPMAVGIRLPLVRFLALKYRAAGCNVYRVRQETNHYELSPQAYYGGSYVTA